MELLQWTRAESCKGMGDKQQKVAQLWPAELICQRPDLYLMRPPMLLLTGLAVDPTYREVYFLTPINSSEEKPKRNLISATDTDVFTKSIQPERNTFPRIFQLTQPCWICWVVSFLYHYSNTHFLQENFYSKQAFKTLHHFAYRSIIALNLT